MLQAKPEAVRGRAKAAKCNIYTGYSPWSLARGYY